MRMVVDTNVLVSAALKGDSFPAMAVRLVEQWGTFLKSSETEAELIGVLDRRQLAALIPSASRSWLSSLMSRAERVTISKRLTACRDPDDDKFIELAVNGAADLILTGDHDLLALDPFAGISIISPARFVATRVLGGEGA